MSKNTNSGIRSAFAKAMHTKSFRDWLIASSVLLALLLVALVIVIAVRPLYNGICKVAGGERRVLVSGDPGLYMRYEPDYASKEEAYVAASAFNERICEEGFVLLENKNGALPLAARPEVTVFGKNSADIVRGGYGSGMNEEKPESGDLYAGFARAGIICNPSMKAFYEDDDASGSGRPVPSGVGAVLTGFPTGETPVSAFTDDLVKSWKSYGDAAIAVISRIGGEGFDLPRTMFWNGRSYDDPSWSGTEKVPGAASVDSHYLELDENEKALLALLKEQKAKGTFEKVIVLINSSSPIEAGFLKDEGVDAALWIGHPGNSGAQAIGRVLCGDVNPSGRTVDTYAADFTKDPTWNNFGNNREKDGNRYTTDGKARNAYFVEYEEGIYVGYRYYETVHAELEEDSAGSGDTWYDEHVVYPFGYGLSYTDFTVRASSPETTELSADSEVTIDVTVKNDGERAGKTVVQLYYTAPYKNGEIEKPAVVLADFVKTDELKAGEERTYTLSVNARDMASYDYSDANGNGFKGYELEAGRYELSVRTDAHTAVASFGLTLSEDVRYETSDAEGREDVKIVNLFDDVSSYIKTYLSRADLDGTMPTSPSAGDREITQEFADTLTFRLNDMPSDPWYTETAPVQSKKELSFDRTEVKLYELYGKDYDDQKWDQLLAQLTVGQMSELISNGNYRTVSIVSIAKPQTTDADGPMGFTVFMGNPTVYDTCFYASECVMGATWNVDMLYEYGVMIGNEGLLGNARGDGRPYSGWYAPAMNIHRSPFGGRNFEYYSEDGLLSGKLASAVVRGAKSKGVYTYCKHFALNEQETNRDTTGLVTWANEQAMRELYFVPFEIAVKEGGTTAMMSSFNRIGITWAGGNYALLTRLLRDEWGFEGTVITDFNLKSYMNIDQMIRAGGDLNLSPGKALSSDDTPTSVAAIRRAAKNILYTVVNSNATNGLGDGIEFTYKMPYWTIVVILIDCAIVAGLAVWGTVLILRRRARKPDGPQT